MSPKVVLKNPEEATVDGVTLTKGAEDPTELTDDQIKRLRSAGAKLEAQESDTPKAPAGNASDEGKKGSGS